MVRFGRISREAGGHQHARQLRLAALDDEADLSRFVTIAPRRLDALRALGEDVEPEAVGRELGVDRTLAGGA